MTKRTRAAQVTLIGGVIMLGALLSLPVQGAARRLSAKEARRAIAAVALKLSGSELKTEAVRVRDIAPASDEATTAVVTAAVETALLFRQMGVENEFHAAEFRVGDREWINLDIFARAFGAAALERARSSLSELIAGLAADSAPAVARSNRHEQEEGGERAAGGVRVRDFSPLLSSAVVVADVEMSFRLVKGADRKWRVSEIKFGDDRWRAVGDLLAVADEDRTTRARAELEVMKTALEAYRRERGFYVVADEQSKLIDHLSPRYLPRIIRLDPWNRPYRYEGTRERYYLRSTGADGVEGTADDVMVSG